jgi:hypothetical protein
VTHFYSTFQEHPRDLFEKLVAGVVATAAAFGCRRFGSAWSNGVSVGGEAGTLACVAGAIATDHDVDLPYPFGKWRGE